MHSSTVRRGREISCKLTLTFLFMTEARSPDTLSDSFTIVVIPDASERCFAVSMFDVA
jgi:hypothetical protein